MILCHFAFLLLSPFDLLMILEQGPWDDSRSFLRLASDVTIDGRGCAPHSPPGPACRPLRKPPIMCLSPPTAFKLMCFLSDFFRASLSS